MSSTQRSSFARKAKLGLWAGLVMLLALPAWAGYTAALDQALFYLSRGSTYGPDAVRSLRQAEAEDPTRAWSDPRWLEAAARAYVQTGRHTEAYWALERLEAQGALGPEAAALREHLLEASGLGRVRMVSAVPLDRVRLRMAPLDPAALDPAGRRAVERLSELFDRGLGVGPAGTVLLVPEGRFRVAFDPATPLEAPKDAVDLEVWAGDEVDLRLVPRYPRPASWRVGAGARTVDLAWPPLVGMTYRLVREVPDGPVIVCEGSEPSCRDQGLAVGVDAAYRLEVRTADGTLAAVGRVTARTLAPVERAAAEAQVQDDLRVAVAWVLGDGAVDEVRVMREGSEGDRIVLRRRSPEPLREGQAVDGPFLPEARPRPVSYRIEAWVAGAEAPAAAAWAEVEIPARVERVAEVAESVDRGLVVVYWETLPREAAAQSYRIYRQRGRGTLGELVGEISDAFAREYSYEVADPLEASQWRHFVIPVVGGRWILDPEWIRATGEEPDQRFGKRRRMGQTLPDLALSWDPCRGARLYAVVVGEKEVLVKRPYVEVDGLQTPLLATRHPVRVYAVGAGGERVPLLTVDLSYRAYPRPAKRGARP